MVTILINPAFIGADLIRGEVLIRRQALISMWIPKGAALIRGNTASVFHSYENSHYGVYIKETNQPYFCSLVT